MQQRGEQRRGRGIARELKEGTEADDEEVARLFDAQVCIQRIPSWRRIALDDDDSLFLRLLLLVQ